VQNGAQGDTRPWLVKHLGRLMLDGKAWGWLLVLLYTSKAREERSNLCACCCDRYLARKFNNRSQATKAFDLSGSSLNVYPVVKSLERQHPNHTPKHWSIMSKSPLLPAPTSTAPGHRAEVQTPQRSQGEFVTDRAQALHQSVQDCWACSRRRDVGHKVRFLFSFSA
jgi:hypothetical protein